MKAQIQDIENAQKEILFSLTPEDMVPFLDKAARRLQKGIQIKGFRAGAIPRAMVEKKLGKAAVWQESAFDAIEQTYIDAMHSYAIEAIGKPRIDILKLAPDNNFEFRAAIPIMPQLSLPEYKNISRRVLEKEKKELAVNDQEIEDVLSWLYSSHQKAEKNQIKKEKKPLPEEFTNDFARSIGNFKDLAALRASIHDGLLEEKREQEKQRLRLSILKEIIKQVDVPVADSLLTSELDRMQEEFKQSVASLNTSFEDYLKKIDKSINQLRNDWREKAKERVMTSLLLRSIAQKEGIEATTEEVEVEANKYLHKFRSLQDADQTIDPEALRSYIRGIIQNEKVFQFLEQQS